MLVSHYRKYDVAMEGLMDPDPPPRHSLVLFHISSVVLPPVPLLVHLLSDRTTREITFILFSTLLEAMLTHTICRSSYQRDTVRDEPSCQYGTLWFRVSPPTPPGATW